MNFSVLRNLGALRLFLACGDGWLGAKGKVGQNSLLHKKSGFRISRRVIILHAFAPVKITLLPVSVGPE